jgi:hypothetical protein
MTWEPVKHRTYTLEDMTERLMEHFNVDLDDKGTRFGRSRKYCCVREVFQRVDGR